MSHLYNRQKQSNNSPSVGKLVGSWEVVDPLVVVKTLNFVVVG